MFMVSHTIGTIALGIEGVLSWLAFSGYTNDCTTYPCKIQSLYNQNFANIPVVGQICNFYPMLNISSVPILTITLRNNLMEVLPIKRWLSKSNNCVCKFLLQDDRKLVKGVWSILLNLPVIVVVIFERNP